MAEKKRLALQWSGLDLTTHLSRLPVGAIRMGWNYILYDGLDDRAGVPRKFKGSREIPYDGPAGVNTGLGFYWDETGDTLIGFVHNSQGNHFILWMHPEEASARVIVIPKMDLRLGHPVTGCALVNQKDLAFTDGATYPKMIDLPKADDTNKRSIVNMYFPPSPGAFVARDWDVTITGMAPNQPVAGATQQQMHDFPQSITYFVQEFNSNPVFQPFFHAVAMGHWIQFTAVNPGMVNITGRVQDHVTTTVTTTVTSNCISEYENRYNAPFTDEQIRLARVAPLTIPTAVMAHDDAHAGNNILGKVFQFQASMGFTNHQKSVTSPTSDIALPASTTCSAASTAYNCVDVGFDNPWLTDPAMRGEISHVNLYVKEVDGGAASGGGVNAGVWKLFQTLDKWEWIFPNSRVFRFYNDGTYQGSDQAYNNAGNTNVPPLAGSMDVIVSTDDTTLIVMGDITQGDPTPNVDMTANVRISPQSTGEEYVSVHARIIIAGIFDPTPAPQVYNINQPIITYNNTTGPVFGGMGPALGDLHTGDPETWGQKLPLGGFVGYLAGTDLYGISMQTNTPVTVNLSGGTVRATEWSAPNHPANGRKVYDGTSLGFAANPVNRTHRSAVREMLQGQHVYSDLDIGGLQRGRTYILRMASNLCNFDTGDIYDLNSPTRGYQRTSTRTVQVGSVTGDPNIKIGTHECVITVPLVGPPVIEIGNIVIMDATNPNVIDGSFVIDGYLFDNLGIDYSPSADIRTTGVTAERQMVRFLNHDGSGYSPFPTPQPSYGLLSLFLWPIFAPTILYNAIIIQMLGGPGNDQNYVFTDHNGYWFFFNKNQVGHSPRAEWLSITGNPGSPAGTLTPTGSTGYIICNDFTGGLCSKWEGGLDTPTLTGPIVGNLFNGPGWKQYIMANLYSGTDMRTHVVTRFVDLSGAPVPGVVALLENGRSATSDPNGDINLIVFGDVEANNDDRMRDSFVLSGSGACSLTFPGGNIVPLQINAFQAGGNYGENQIYWRYLPDILATIAAGLSFRGFGRGAIHGLGYYLQRDNGDRTPVESIGKLLIPELNQDLHVWDPFLYPGLSQSSRFVAGFGVVDWALGGIPPTPWIGRWSTLRFVLTYDLARVWYVQWLASSVTYSTIFVTDPDPLLSSPTPTSYASANATEIYISVGDSFWRYSHMNSASMSNQADAGIGYLWQKGDRVKILTDQNQFLLRTVIDVEITAQRGQWITVAATSSIPLELKAGMVIEIYRPRKAVESEVQEYYDIPYQVGINYDSNGNPSWAQMSGTIDWGSDWLIPRSVPIQPVDSSGTALGWTTRTYKFQSKWIWDNYPSIAWGHGKVAVADPDAVTRRYGNVMRYSHGMSPNTNNNGLNLFDGLDDRVVPNWLGAIRFLMYLGTELFGGCENGCFAVYIGVSQVQPLPDGNLTASGKVLENVRPFAGKFGCRDPLSAVRGNNMIVFFSRTTGDAMQYASNQLQSISQQNRTAPYFKAKALEMQPDTLVCAGFDPVHGEFIWTFGPHQAGLQRQPVAGESIKYFDGENKWTCKLAVSPDCWGKTRQRLWSFTNGKLWLHHDTDDYNSLCGVKVPMSISLPAVAGWSINAKWHNVHARLVGDNWKANLTNSKGQSVAIAKFDFHEYEQWKASATLLPGQGGSFPGSECIVEMINDDPGYAECVAVWMNVEESGNNP